MMPGARGSGGFWGVEVGYVSILSPRTALKVLHSRAPCSRTAHRVSGAHQATTLKTRWLTSRASRRQFMRNMDLSDDEQAVLRELVKTSRQRHHQVKWVDRDGSDRMTALTQPEVIRLNALAHRLGLAKGEVLRRAAHIPVSKPAG